MKRVLPWDGDETELSSIAESATQNAHEHILSAESPKASNDASSLMRDKDPVQAVDQRDHMRPQRLRIVLYSPGMIGLGHIRRNLLIAQTFAYPPLQNVILMIAEAREASVFKMPNGVDCLTLPALRKDFDGQSNPRYLDISVQELTAIRANVIRATIEAFKPDVLIVDHLPWGALRELEPTLEYLRLRGHTRCVLGLRDVLEDPVTMNREWSSAANEDAIREYYDAVWVYGDPNVYSLVCEYHLPRDIAAKVCYTGYLDQRMRLKLVDPNTQRLDALKLPPGKLVLCLVGGGQDGAHLAEAFIRADLPKRTNGVIVTGPYIPVEVQERLCRSVAMRPRLRIFEFVKEPVMLVNNADWVIAMGGYSTVCEVLSFGKRALIVPRAKPRYEQAIRAERLSNMGLLDVLHPNELTPQALTDWLACDIKPPQVRDRIDLNGLARLPHLLEEVLAAPPHSARSKLHKGGIQHID